MTEKEKYEELWSGTNYRRVSPGEILAPYFIDVCKPAPGDTIVDVGCGTGRAAKTFRSHGLSPYGVDIAKNCLDESMEDLPFLEGEIFQVTAPVDWVYCTDMLEHLSEDEVLPHLNHMKKMMVKGAFFQISLRPSVKDRPDEGYVLHRSVHRAPWWIDHLDTVFDTKVEVQPATRVTGKEHGLIAWTFAKPKEA